MRKYPRTHSLSQTKCVYSPCVACCGDVLNNGLGQISFTLERFTFNHSSLSSIPPYLKLQICRFWHFVFSSVKSTNQASVYYVTTTLTEQYTINLETTVEMGSSGKNI